MDFQPYFSKENHVLIMNFFKSVMNLSQEIDKLFSVSSLELRRTILDQVVQDSSYMFIKSNYQHVFNTIKEIKTKVLNLLNLDSNQNTISSKKDQTFKSKYS